LLEARLNNVLIYKYHIFSDEWIYLYDIATAKHGIAANFFNPSYSIAESHFGTPRVICWLYSKGVSELVVYVTTNILTIRISTDISEIGISIDAQVKKYNFTTALCDAATEVTENMFDIIGPFMEDYYGAPNYTGGYTPPPNGSWVGPNNLWHPTYKEAVDDYYEQYYNFRRWYTYIPNSTSLDAIKAGADYWTDGGYTEVFPISDHSGQQFIISNLGTSYFDTRQYFGTQTSESYRGRISNL
jgi:hypothetical protein